MLAGLLAGCVSVEPRAEPGPATSGPPTTAETELLPKELSGPSPKLLDYHEVQRLLPDEPETAPLRVRAEQTLRQETLRMAGVEGRVTARCTDDLSDCRSTYDGLAIRWEVSSETLIEQHGPLPGTTGYSFRPLKALVTAEMAYRQLWPTGPEYPVRCEELPAAFLADLGGPSAAAATGYQCQQLLGPDENNVRHWREFSLHVEEDGSVFWE